MIRLKFILFIVVPPRQINFMSPSPANSLKHQKYWYMLGKTPPHAKVIQHICTMNSHLPYRYDSITKR